MPQLHDNTGQAGPETAADSAPRSQYERRKAARQEEAARQEQRETLAGLARVITFLSIAAALYLGIGAGGWLVAWLILTVCAFVAAVAWHRRVVGRLARAQRAVGYYATGLDRLDDRWPGTGPNGETYRRAEHPYAADLDLFGHGSLFQLLCAARTRMGQDTLAAWLLSPADPLAIRMRHSAIRELRGNVDLREEMAVLDAPIKTDLNPQSLLAWTSGPRVLADRVRPALAVVLALAAIAALVGWQWFGIGLLPFLVVAILEGALLGSMRRQVRELTRNLESVLGQLNLLVQVLRIMEVQQFSSPRLREIISRLHTGGRLPSQRVARLARLADYWETIRRNQFVAPFAFLLMLGVHLAYSIQRWRIHNGPLVCGWLETVGEFEALECFSLYAYEHPQHPFPEILETGPHFEAKGLGHPLIPTSRRVTNDVELGSQRQLLLVSGSNMSGKSTLLRTVGINAVLALAGAPVCAALLRVSRATVASAMRNVDSLQEGVSAFYAEIQRLRTICDLAGGTPKVLFLLDEILHGTNSHDRRIGAEAVIEDLLRQGAIGLITTHDLALAEIAQRLAPRAANVHFEDELVDGRIHFDYQLRPGVVPKGNGLVLMRLLGFEV